MREALRIARPAVIWKDGLPGITEDVVNLTSQAVWFDDGELPEPGDGQCSVRFVVLVYDDEDAQEQSFVLCQCESEAEHDGPHSFDGEEWTQFNMQGQPIAYVRRGGHLDGNLVLGQP